MRSPIQRIALLAGAVLALTTLTARAMDRTPPSIGRYVSEEWNVGFVLDRSQAVARLKFDGAEEVYALKWQPAANGDQLLVRDDDVVVFRLTPLGGITYFDPRVKSGIPVAFNAPAMPLEAPPPPIEAIRTVAADWTQRFQEEHQLKLNFEADWEKAASDAGQRALLYDVIRNAAMAVMTLALDKQAVERLRGAIEGIAIAAGTQPSVTKDGRKIRIVFAVDQGLAGRFSSARLFLAFNALTR